MANGDADFEQQVLTELRRGTEALSAIGARLVVIAFLLLAVLVVLLILLGSLQAALPDFG